MLLIQNTKLKAKNLFFKDEASVVGETQRREGQGYYETDEAQQRTPHGEREENDGRVQAHDLAHDAWREVHVLDGLHDGKHGQRHEQDNPEVLPRLEALHEGQHDGGDEADELEVGHQVEDADEQAQADGHGEVDDEEPDGEEDAHDEGDERLAAEVGVHAVLHVVAQVLEEGAVGCWEQLYPAFGEAFVVDQDEEHVEEDDEDGEDAGYPAECLDDEVPDLDESRLHGVAHVVLLNELHDVVFVEEALDVGTQVFGDALLAQVLLGYGHDVLADFCCLLNDGGHDEHEQSHQGGHDQDEGHGDAEYAVAQSAAVLQEDDQGVDHVGQQPGDGEGQEHGTEVLDEQPQAHDNQDHDEVAHETVEGYFLFGHGGVGFVAGLPDGFMVLFPVFRFSPWWRPYSRWPPVASS